VLTGRVESLLERDRVFKRAPKRRIAYEAVEALGGLGADPSPDRSTQSCPAVCSTGS